MKIVDFAALRSVIEGIGTGATVAISGAGGGLLEPETIFRAFEEVFLETGKPSQLTLIHALGMGDRVEKGTNRFAY